jgi:hypothetical protein
MFARDHMLETTATGFASHKTTGFKAITRGAIFAVVQAKAGVKPGVVKEDLIKALMLAGLSNGTANNYTSRCLTVARFFRWEATLNAAVSFEENADTIAPYVVALWGEINEIKKTGPLAERPETAPKSRKTGDAPEAPVSLAAAAPVQLGGAVKVMLANATAEQQPGIHAALLSGMDTQTLVDLQAAIVSELASREAAAREPMAQAA